MIRLGVDAWNFPGDRRGIGRYLREILRVWWDGARDRVDVTLIVPEWHTWTVRQRYLQEVDHRPYRVVSRRLHGRAGLDALWFPFNGCSWTNFSLPATATLHDASNFVVPEYAPETQTIFRAAAKRCRALITDSRFAQARARARARGPAREPRPYPARRRSAASAGARCARRRRTDAVRPICRERREAQGFRYAARCDGGRCARKYRSFARRDDASRGLADSSRCERRQLGHVDDDTLAALYRGCAALAFPSRYEGFGLPVLEAMSYGAPVIASRASAVPEAAGDAACYVIATMLRRSPRRSRASSPTPPTPKNCAGAGACGPNSPGSRPQRARSL